MALTFYADDTRIFYQNKDIHETKGILTEEFAALLCEWFFENKLLIHFEEDKTKRILFSKTKFLSRLNKTTEIITLRSAIM